MPYNGWRNYAICAVCCNVFLNRIIKTNIKRKNINNCVPTNDDCLHNQLFIQFILSIILIRRVYICSMDIPKDKSYVQLFKR